MPFISVDHPEALSDRAVRIRIGGFPPREKISVAASRTDLFNRNWRAWAEFTTDETGAVDLARDAPIGGTYGGVSPMGLFWSMDLLPEQAPKEPWRSVTEGYAVHLTAARIDGDEWAELTVQRNFAGPGVTAKEVSQDGLVGTVFLPVGRGPHPSMIVLSGSSGGTNLSLAALLASHGYAGLALGYFGMEGLPSYLADIPLEYFERAIGWLQMQPEIDDRFIGVTGISRGGELSLLLAATFPQIKAVVAYVPSAVLHGPYGFSGGDDDAPQASWTHKGEALPFLSQFNAYADTAFAEFPVEPALATTPVFRALLKDHAAVERAMIPVERINGPVMMISGTDDQMWPSTEMSALAERRLLQTNHQHAVVHLAYEGAGHIIVQPYAPTTVRHSIHPISGNDYAYGGSARADADAAADSWPRVLDFLDAARAGVA